MTRTPRRPVRHRFHPMPALVAITVAITLAAPSADAGAPERGQRIVLVTLDTLRLDSLVGGEGRATQMPETLAWTESARTYLRHYATSTCTQPTHASLLTGLQPWEHAVITNGLVLDEDVRTVPERLRDAGFDTGAVVAAFPVSEKLGFGQGFRVFRENFSRTTRDRWEGQGVPERRFYGVGNRTTKLATEVLAELRGDRQFLWVHYFDPHTPYGDRPEASPGLKLPKLLGRFGRSSAEDAEARDLIPAYREAYDGDVRDLDRFLARLLRRLTRDEASFETHVVVVSDHGESFGESGSLGHGKRLTDEQIRVPLVVRSPRLEPGRSEAVVGSVDVAATILGLAGISDPALPGRDLSRAGVEALRSPRPPVVGMRRTYAEPYDEIRTDGKWYRLPDHLFFAVHEDRVYRGNRSGVLANDGGTVNETVAGELKGRFAAFEERVRAVESNQEVVDPATREALEALGYAR